ncbi:23S rRNA (adenine(1618)-N(6))-methyltransferase RlmF [Xanthomarina sp. F2636L]|uniref:23S rRNA (adenine(1618)-N(6))-methyltransferase RlmF n=1 Tax=Xanthomarina sp. F2636L TaxID=2996018 RepID=UPI00225E0B11|nr:23S rRNA (adenine(1618)-N(6))-methyltransferase RlmF [Xanthomarina sp. F2636L]MCX7549556.1 23S rRNA (adenine(1618)-N(6))-methyltransferase RlmF [Xanthomarina sp. F2636L]
MHTRNLHRNGYIFEELIENHHPLEDFVFTNDYQNKTIDFSNPDAVFHLNKALLKTYYQITDWHIPKGYLCSPIPGRADYIHQIADLLQIENSKDSINGLDIGVGANCIYPLLGAQIYHWKMVGSDIQLESVDAAKHNVSLTDNLSDSIEIRHQTNPANIFEGIILPNEYYHFTMCNPPFHASEKDALKGSKQKLKNLKIDGELLLNFGGQANELWCNGGEALFIKRMIKQSIGFKNQVLWFTSLVSKKEHIPKFQKQLNKLNASYKIIEMFQGNKKSRILAWSFKHES